MTSWYCRTLLPQDTRPCVHPLTTHQATHPLMHPTTHPHAHPPTLVPLAAFGGNALCGSSV